MPLKKTEVFQFLHENNLTCYYVYDYARLYGKEEAFMRLINIVAVIAIFIGGLGIFAFSVFFVCQPQEGGGSAEDQRWYGMGYSKTT